MQSYAALPGSISRASTHGSRRWAKPFRPSGWPIDAYNQRISESVISQYDNA